MNTVTTTPSNRILPVEPHPVGPAELNPEVNDNLLGRFRRIQDSVILLQAVLAVIDSLVFAKAPTPHPEDKPHATAPH